MDISTFRTAQEPIKERYKNDAKAAFLTLRAKGVANDATVTCKVETGRGLALQASIPRPAVPVWNSVQGTCYWKP